MSAIITNALYGPDGFFTINPPPEWWSTVDETKAPFPWFGGKSKVAHIVWDRFGEVKNYVEPFAGSLAVLLGRPHAPTIETVNDFDSMDANFWRALAAAPDKVAEYADWPVNETDLHARHKWLVTRKAMLRARLFNDPTYFDARIAGWWIWGLCAWIGSGWCTQDGKRKDGEMSQRMPFVAGSKGNSVERGVHKRSLRLPAIGGGNGTDHPHTGRGVNSARMRSEGQVPHLGGTGMDHGRGVHSVAMRQEGQLPSIGAKGDSPRGGQDGSQGINARGNRSRLVEVFRALANRLRFVRVTCGDFERILSESVTWRHGTTGVFLDPPYPADAGSTGGIYDSAANERDTFDRAFRYCIENGHDKRLRIALCYYEGTESACQDNDGNERVRVPVTQALEKRGWIVVPWKATGGYAGQSGNGNENAARERIAFSPHCARAAQASLF